MGSRVQALTLDIEKDYWDKENCTEVLNLSRPDLVREIHKGYYAAGSDMVQTNSFGGSPITLGEFDLQDRAFEINKIAGELAREAAELFADGRTRYVVGSIGPGTKLPSLGNIAYDPLEEALFLQSQGLIAGGVDVILIETCQDTLQIKAAVNGAKRARAAAGSDIPIFVQVTVETTGTLLVGPDIAAAATVIHALDVPLIGLNCATGPQEMAEHVRFLSQNWPGLISVQPNAGLPELVNGATHYPLGAEEMASWVERFVVEDGVNLIGGCCGTSIPHIQGLNAMLNAPRQPAPHAGIAQIRLGPLRRQPVRRHPLAPGEQLFLHRRALQRQRLQKMARIAGSRRLGWLRRRRPRAGRGILQRAGYLHRLRRPQRDRGDERNHHPLHRLGERAAGHRLHRNPGHRSRPETAWRQADHQLDQFRGWRRPRHGPSDPREKIWRGGHRAHHR